MVLSIEVFKAESWIYGLAKAEGQFSKAEFIICCLVKEEGQFVNLKCKQVMARNGKGLVF